MADFELRAAPKPAPRLVNRAAGRGKVYAEGRCRACGGCDNRLERHHLVPRSLGGDDVDDNLVPICPECHGYFERSPRLRSMVGHALRLALTVDELDYVMRTKGAGFLDRYYPPHAAIADV